MKTKNCIKQRKQKTFSKYSTGGECGGAHAFGMQAFGSGSEQHAMGAGSNVIAVNQPLVMGGTNLAVLNPQVFGGKTKKRGGNHSNLAKIAVPALLTYAATMVAPRSRKTYKGYKGRKFNRSRRFSRRNR